MNRVCIGFSALGLGASGEKAFISKVLHSVYVPCTSIVDTEALKASHIGTLRPKYVLYGYMEP